MKKRKKYSSASKAKVAFETIREELTLSKLVEKHGMHANQISQRKRAKIENMETAFTRGQAVSEEAISAEIKNLLA